MKRSTTTFSTGELSFSVQWPFLSFVPLHETYTSSSHFLFIASLYRVEKSKYFHESHPFLLFTKSCQLLDACILWHIGFYLCCKTVTFQSVNIILVVQSNEIRQWTVRRYAHIIKSSLPYKRIQGET